MGKMYKTLMAVAISVVPCLLGGCSDNEEPVSGETMSKSDSADEVDPYEPIVYVDTDMDFSTMSLYEYDDYVQHVQSILSPAYSDRLFSDDAVDTNFPAAGGRKSDNT